MKIAKYLPMIMLAFGFLFVTPVLGQKSTEKPLRDGMIKIIGKPFMMGPNDESVLSTQKDENRMISVNDFFMDAEEVTNKQYRAFVNWVRDSIAMDKLIGDDYENSIYAKPLAGAEELGTDRPYKLNWDKRSELQKDYKRRLDPEDEVYEILSDMYYDNGFGKLNTGLLRYEYVWTNIEEAAKPSNRFNVATGKYPVDAKVRVDTFYVDESGAIKRETIERELKTPSDLKSNVIICVYPDTLVWARDFEYSHNDPLVYGYFMMACYADYPVVGVTWEQAMAYCDWVTKETRRQNPGVSINQFRLPTEAEWEFAARGGLRMANYPWGNEARPSASFPLANFKSNRGVYNQDDAVTTTKVGCYPPNAFGLRDMAGNVAEWTSTTYAPTINVKNHDMNPEYTYMAREDDPKELKRKTVKGGSWKDISYYLQCGVRTYEYQNECHSYIGFRCVRSCAGVDRVKTNKSDKQYKY